MEKQDPTGITDRRMDRLDVGDYVISVDPEYHYLEVGKIVSFHGDDTFIKFKGMDGYVNGMFFRKITQQEYIVAKLKGKLYE